MARKSVTDITTKKKTFSARSGAGAQIKTNTTRSNRQFNTRRFGSGLLKIAIVGILIKLGLKKL